MTLAITRGAAPVFITVTVCGKPLVPTNWFGKVILYGETLATGATALPVSITLCGLLGALSVTVKDAVRLPVALGAKVILNVQVAPASTLVPQLLVWEKSPALAPVIAMLEIVSVPVPPLDKLSAWAELLVPTAWLVKLTVVPEKVTAGATPVPVSATVCGLSAALSVMVTLAARVPVAVGPKITLIVQLAPAATELPHVLLWLKSPLLVPVTAMPAIVSAAKPVFFSITCCDALVVPAN